MRSLKDFFGSDSARLKKPLPRIAILISGRGSNMQALLQKIRERKLKAECVLVVSDREAKGIEVARGFGVRAEVIGRAKGEPRETFDTRLAARLKEAGVQVVVCAGYLRILSEPMLKAYPRRILNVHPSILPAFPGMNAQQQALDYGVKLTGCTIHLVDAGVDTGKILAQAAVPVVAGDTAGSLSRRILQAEHELYWKTVQAYLTTLPA